jgi:hypothetical protein
VLVIGPISKCEIVRVLLDLVWTRLDKKCYDLN